MVQTCASAGEAVAVGVVFTVPALIIIHYWLHFDYWQNFSIAIVGGVLGVLFTIPLRKLLVASKELPFPEANAVTHVLQTNHQKALGLREMLCAGIVGGLLEIAQTGLKIIASSAQAFFSVGKMLVGFGAGFSATLIGAGYLIGATVGFSLLVGAVIAWLVCVPLLGHFGTTPLLGIDDALASYGAKIRYIGIGVMPHSGMDPSHSFAAPPAAMMATVIQGVFSQNLPWPLFGIGATIIGLIVILNRFLKKHDKALSLLGVALGIYLPLAYSTPLIH